MWHVEVGCLLTHLKMLNSLRKGGLDWGLWIINQEAIKSEIRWQVDYMVLWFLFERGRMGLKKPVLGLHLCVVCLHRKLCEPNSFVIPDLMTNLLRLLAHDSYDKNSDHCFFQVFLWRTLHLASCIRHTASGSMTLMCRGHSLNWSLWRNLWNERCCQDTFCFLLRYLVQVLLHSRHNNGDVADLKSAQVLEGPLNASSSLQNI